MAQSQLLGSSMIHVATDDSYSILSLWPAPHINTHTHIDAGVSASGYYANMNIRHASLSEIAAPYLLSRSERGLPLTVKALAHPCNFTHQQYLTCDHLYQCQRLLCTFYITFAFIGHTDLTCTAHVSSLQVQILQFACFTNANHAKVEQWNCVQLVKHSPNVSDTMRRIM